MSNDCPPPEHPATSPGPATGATASRRALLAALAAGPFAAVLAACGGGGGGGGDSAVPAPSPTPAPTPTPTPTPSPTPTPAPSLPAIVGPAWGGFANDARHTANGAVATQPITRLVWSAAVDMAPAYTAANQLLIHYGSPVITERNTVVMPVKTGATGGFRIDARAGADGALLWSQPTDYLLPTGANWTPSFNIVLAGAQRIAMPAAAGRITFRDSVDLAAGTTQTVAFYGDAVYAAATATYADQVRIDTPLTADAQGNVFFGFSVSGSNPAGLTGGIARVSASGVGSWVKASAISADDAVLRPAINAAPALSPDGLTLYVVIAKPAAGTARASGYLVALDSSTLAVRNRVALTDPQTGRPANVSENGSASPMVGPDGDVYIGVLESVFGGHNARGWLLHFDASLAQTLVPGSFGWDITPSVVPVAMVPTYAGTSAYLLFCKYNNYGGAGTGDGKNRIAILDPKQPQADTISGIPVMREVQTILGPTPDPDYAGGVKEWCINTGAVDAATSSVLVNSEDGILYRWHLPGNAFTERIGLNSGIGQAYTPTLIGPDGRVYAINNATLYSIGR